MFRFGDPGGRAYGAVGASAVNLIAYWSSVSTAANWSVSASNGRHDSGSSLRHAALAGSTTDLLVKTLDAQTTWGVAMGVRFAALPTATAPFLFVRDAGTTQVDLRLGLDGTLVITRNGTTLATSTNTLSVNVYYHIEMKVTVHNTAGNYEVRVNGTATGWVPPQGGTANTRSTANNTANQVAVGGITASAQTFPITDFDDVIVYDGQTTDANGFTDISTFVGDCGLYWLPPSADGTTSQWTPDTSTVHYSRVNEATPDGDTSYVEDGTVNDTDTYAHTALAAGVTAVKTVALVHYCKKTDVGSRGMKAVVRSASANMAHATEIALSNSYTYPWSAFGQDPNNGSATNWTTTSINAAEIGQKVSS